MKNNFSKKITAFPLAIAIIASSSTMAVADTGYTGEPPKDTPLQEYMYKTYAPKTQTTFKEFQTITQSVDDVLLQNQKLMIYGGAIVTGGTMANAVNTFKKTPYVGKAVAVVQMLGGAIGVAGAFGTVSLLGFEKGSVIKHKVYFRWTNPRALEYEIRNYSWVEYKGHRVSDISASTSRFRN